MKIAIIGSGGAGMTSAWLLDGQHDITLFERNAELGGHAHTTTIELDGKQHHADDGFAWFSDVLYPNYMRLLELIGVPTRIVPMSASFTQRRQGRTLVLPPTTLATWWRTLSRPATVRDLLELNRAIALATPMVHNHDNRVSWGEFVAKHKFNADFVRDLLTPIVAGTWGGPYERMADFSAYTLMKYLVFHRPSSLARYKWHVVRDGAASYIQSVAATLRTTTVLAGTAVEQFEPTLTGWRVHDQHGVAREFDHILVATGARDAQALIREAPGLDVARKVLSGFEYYSVRLATHSDPSFMPPRRGDWQAANIMADGDRANLTVWTDAHRGSEVFTSYLSDREPKNCYNVSTFHLPLITPGHYDAQEELARIQGQHHVSFAGDWTHDIGCHEDAVVSAILACRGLDATLPRLALLSTEREHPNMQALPGQTPRLEPQPA